MIRIAPPRMKAYNESSVTRNGGRPPPASVSRMTAYTTGMTTR